MKPSALAAPGLGIDGAGAAFCLRMSCCIVVAGCFALSKFLILNNNLCRINLLSITVRIASCLNTSCNCNFQSLTEILLSKLCCTSKRNTADKISSCFSVTTESSVYCQCISGNCQGIFSLRNISPQDLLLSVPLKLLCSSFYLSYDFTGLNRFLMVLSKIHL